MSSIQLSAHPMPHAPKKAPAASAGNHYSLKHTTQNRTLPPSEQLANFTWHQLQRTPQRQNPTDILARASSPSCSSSSSVSAPRSINGRVPTTLGLMYTTFPCISARGCFKDLNPWPQSQGLTHTCETPLMEQITCKGQLHKAMLLCKGQAQCWKLPHKVGSREGLYEASLTPAI
jgi:hypothetical protein